MKKLQLLGATALAVSSVSAMEPREFPGTQILAVSPDGKLSASEYLGTVTIIDNETGTTTVYKGDEMNPYDLGQGNCMSSTGITVGSLNTYPGYFKDGEFHILKVDNPSYYSMAHGITPDGLRICGAIGAAPISTDDTDVPMLIPAVWNLQADGTYSDPVILPYPKKDFTGRMPQYVTTICISDDGKTAAGIVTDYSGSRHSLIYYTLNDDNEWVMHNEFERAVNPDNITIPPYPGDCPAAPTKEQFMTSDEIQAYNDALQAWNEAGTWDYSTYPNIDDFMTDEELAAYESAYSNWETNDFQPWQTAFDAFQEAFYSCGGYSITFNQLCMSPDGKTAMSTGIREVEDPDSFFGVSDEAAPISFNLEDDSYKSYPALDMSPRSITNDGTLFAYYRSPDGDPEQAWVFLPGTDSDPVSLLDYMKSRNEVSYQYMLDHMVYDLETFDWDTSETVVIADYLFSGIPYADPEMKVVACFSGNYWDPYGEETFSWLLPLGGADAVKNVADAAETNVMVFKGGRIVIEGNASAVEVYDLNGRSLFSTGAANGTVATGLSNGTYIVKVTTADGVKVRKAIF